MRPPYRELYIQTNDDMIYLTVISYLVPPAISQSCLSTNKTTTITHFQRYSQDASILESMIRDQAAYPPNYAIRLRGTHTETFKTREGKKERKVITDFDIRVNMTHLLVCPNPKHAQDPTPCNLDPHPHPQPHDPPQDMSTPSCKYITILGPNDKGYRGSILSSVDKVPLDPEAPTTLASWCNAYVSDPHTVKTFTLRKDIRLHDSARLEELCRNLINKTSYRGHTTISFETTLNTIIVNSPCRLNSWRYKWWLRWLCYLSFLWLLTWPILFFSTRRYEVVTAVFPYRLNPARSRLAKPLVQSEEEFFREWEQSIMRAVLGQHQGWVDGIYREETAQMTRAGNAVMTVQSSENRFEGFMVGAVRMALGVPTVTGWGADC
jgi:hypothetical protein